MTLTVRQSAPGDVEPVRPADGLSDVYNASPLNRLAHMPSGSISP